MPDTPEDVVKEAREFIGVVGNCGIYPDHAKRHIASLCDEVQRLQQENTELRKCDACERNAIDRNCRQHRY